MRIALRLARFSNGSLEYFMRMPLNRLARWAKQAGRIQLEERADK